VETDILLRRRQNFVLWSPRAQSQAPALIIGTLVPGNPPSVANVQRFALSAAAGVATGLWQIAAEDCELEDGALYHYWLEVDDSRSGTNPPARVAVTDPFARSVDWRVFPPNASDLTQPAAVVRYAGAGLLDESDPGGEDGEFEGVDAPETYAPNNQLVIYELPTAWTLSRAFSAPERAAATFGDAAALADERLGGVNFAELEVLSVGRAYLEELGVNAVEILPPADSFYNREWGYGTSHYLAPDYELGYPEGNASPTPNRDLTTLVSALHRKNIRLFLDVVMAFGQKEPYEHIDYDDFHIDTPDPKNPPNDEDAYTSGRDGDGHKELRNGFGSTLFRYIKRVNTYDPVSGVVQDLSPASQYMLVYLTRWMQDFRVDGLRLDSVENVANWDFVQAFRERGRELFAERFAAGVSDDTKLARFLVVGEELSLPFGLIRGGRLDGLWNDDFQARIRGAVLGESVGGDNFEWTVRKAINCLSADGFSDGAQVINYVTKHDVEGFRHERLFTMLRDFPRDQIEKRIKLAFTCLLTAVGIPMFLAGEEFGDEHDFFDRDGNVSQDGGKQVDPVNFSRLTADAKDDGSRDEYYAETRRNILAYVKPLIRLRTTEAALGVNDTAFIWTDFGDNKRVLVWQRGNATQRPIIVVANFSDFFSAPGADYRIPTWPATPPGKSWIDLSQNNRPVDPAFVGREAIFPWEAKVYTTVDV